LADRTVSFKLRGNAVGTAVTDANGVATLTGVSLAIINAGGPAGTGYAGAVEASFAGGPPLTPPPTPAI
jgi:hypothetical protein